MPISRAIVIEDSEADRALLVGLLRAAGLKEVSEYDSFPKHFEAPIDAETLIVIDLVLGSGVDGVQAMEALADLSAYHAPVVIVSGNLKGMLDVVETYGTALGLNVAATFEKPVPVDAFPSVIDSLGGVG